MNQETVGQVSYDVRLNLSQLKRDTAEAEKLVNDSYRKMSQASKQRQTTRSTGARSEAEQISKDVQTQIDATKASAQQTLSTISNYTPKVQAQFLAVERANLQVEAATRRSAVAIQRYGADSIQASNASASLTRAVYSQSQAQGRLDNSMKNVNNNSALMTVGMTAAASAAIALGVAIGGNLMSAVRRSDTMANFPRVMQNMKISAEDSQQSIDVLADRLTGLPTTLDSAASGVQRLVSVNNNIGASTEMFLALNNAIIAGGGSIQTQQTAIEQLQQAYSKGKVDLVEWRALMVAMPAQLGQVAEALNFVSTDAMGEALRSGELSIDDFMLSLVRLNSEGANGFASFEDQARAATDGIETGFTNMNTAIARAITNVINAIGRDNIGNAISAIGGAFTFLGNAIANAINLARPLASILSPIFTIAASGVGAFIGLAGAVFVGVRALAALRVAMTLIATHPVFAAISVLAGIATFALGSINTGVEEVTDSSDNMLDSFKDFSPPIRGATEDMGKAAKAAEDLAQRISDINDQMNKVREDYRYSLAQLVADKNRNIAELTAQLGQEETAYNNAYAERLSSFRKNENEQLTTHQQKTQALQNQIDFLTKYNSSANQQQLSQTQFALARENAEYQKATALRKQEFDAQTQTALTEYEKRRAENQKKLEEETALLRKHRDEVLAVRGVMLLDEVQMLQKQRDEQLKSLERQKQQAITSNREAGDSAGNAFGNAFQDQFSDFLKNINKDSKAGGQRAGKSFWDGYISGQNNHVANIGQGWENIKKYGPFALFGGGSLWTWDGLGRSAADGISKSKASMTFELNRSGGGGGGRGFASGGFTGRGGTYEPAGIVHRGEYVLPKDQVNQRTGLPDFDKIGSGGTTVNVTINTSGMFASNKADLRGIAVQMGKLINEEIVANTGRPGIVGI